MMPLPFVPQNIAQPSLTQRAGWAVALYSDFWEMDRQDEYRRSRRLGIRRYRNAPLSRLRADLEPVLKTYPDGTLQHSAAAYVLARYGVDVERNVGRLYASARMDRRPPSDIDNVEPLPAALADLWILRRSPLALKRLMTMASDGHISEEKSFNLVRALRATPDVVLRATNRDPEVWDSLAYGAVDGLPSSRGIREKALLAKLRRDAKRYE